MITLLLAVLIVIVILALIMWAGKPALASMGAPAWALNAIIAIVLILLLLWIANAYGLFPNSLK